MDAAVVNTAFLDGAWRSWTRRLAKAAFVDVAFVGARRKRHSLKVAARCVFHHDSYFCPLISRLFRF